MDLDLGPQKKLIYQQFLFLLAVLLLYMFYIFTNVGNNDYMKIFKKCEPQRQLDHSESTIFTATVASPNPGPKEGYLVWSPQCRIPDIDPLDKSIRPFIQIEEPVVCSAEPPLTKIDGDSLVIVQDAVHHYDPKKRISCCYQEVTRNLSQLRPMENPDDFFSLSPCKTFSKSVRLRYEQFLMVKCTAKGKSKKEVYSNMHATVKISQETEMKIKRKDSSKKQKMSVLIVGFDSVSRLNLIRTMPHTVLYLKSEGWVELKGYNKMEDNTCPNFLAILTGLSPKQIGKYCSPKKDETFDDAPFIWKDYGDEGYVTAYGEDEQWIGTFNYHKKGFTKQPTDYYLRHFMLAAENNMKIRKIEGLKYCLGPISASEHVLNYAIDFTTTFKHYPFFSLFWMNSFSHNNVNTPSSMDLRVLKFFQELTESGVLNNTFVVFLSDHGMRFGPIRQTYVGWMEERLPFVYLWVPPWYKEKYPQSFHNLVSNTDKLTSPYDLHLTLQRVLDSTYRKKIDGCPKCVSLFDAVPWNRSCSDVGVTEHWCTCTDYREIRTDDSVSESLGAYIIHKINDLLSQNVQLVMNSSKCAALTMNRILWVGVKSMDSQESLNDYRMIFETSPGEAMFEASVRLETGHFQLLGTISRINMYDKQSKCVNDTFVKKYCYCENR